MVAESATSPDPPTLIYDGECRVCSLFAGLVGLADFRRVLRVLPFQSRAARNLLRGWTRDEMARAVHLVMPDSRVFSAGEALHWTLALLPVIGPVQRHFFSSRKLRLLVDALYGAGRAVRGVTRCASPRTALGQSPR